MIKKVKYKFNPKTLRFEEEKFSFSKFIYQKVLPKIAFSAVLGIGLGTAATYYIGSPAERDARNENETLKQQFAVLNQNLLKCENELAEIQNRDDNVYRAIFEAKPVSQVERRGGFGGVDRYEVYRGYDNSNTMVETAYKLDVISREIVVQSKSFDEVVDLVKEKEKMLACIPSIRPIATKDFIRFGSPFGMRFHPILHYSRLHAGVDLTAATGTPIYASGSGTVIFSGVQTGYGNVVKVNHGYGYMTVYAHCSKLLVETGQKVNRGDVIALVGSTGLSTSPHLHYEVRINNNPVNPINFYKDGLSEEEYQKLLEASKDQNIYEE